MMSSFRRPRPTEAARTRRTSGAAACRIRGGATAATTGGRASVAPEEGGRARSGPAAADAPRPAPVPVTIGAWYGTSGGAAARAEPDVGASETTGPAWEG